MAELRLQGKIIIAGEARGRALVGHEPLSFWGGYDWKTGEIGEAEDQPSRWITLHALRTMRWAGQPQPAITGIAA